MLSGLKPFYFNIFLFRTTGQVNNIVVEMKTEKANEEAGLLNKKVNTEQVNNKKLYI